MLSCYGNYFRSPPRTLPRCRSSCLVCSYRAGCRRRPPRTIGVASPKACRASPLGASLCARGHARSRSRPPRGGSFESLQRAALRARTATPASRLLETWLRRCPVLRRVRSGLVLCLCPVRHRNHFCVTISEPPGLLNVGYETEIRGTSSLGGGALPHFFSCPFSPRAARLPSRVLMMGCIKRRLNPTQGQCV